MKKCDLTNVLFAENIFQTAQFSMLSLPDSLLHDIIVIIRRLMATVTDAVGLTTK